MRFLDSSLEDCPHQRTRPAWRHWEGYVRFKGSKNKRRPTFVIGVFCHFSVFRRIGVTCAKSNHDRPKTHFGAIFLVLLKHTFDGLLGAPLRTTILQRGVPGESIFLGTTILLEGAQEAAIIRLPEPQPRLPHPTPNCIKITPRLDNPTQHLTDPIQHQTI